MLLIQTNTGCERMAEAVLTAPHRACRVYFPKVLTRRSHARRVDYVERPFVQRYAFVAQDRRGGELWRVLRTAPGVAGIVAVGRKVALAACEIVRREVDGYVRLDDEELVPGEDRPFEAGDAVSIGALGKSGIFCRMRSERRAEIFLGSIRTTVDVTDLVAA